MRELLIAAAERAIRYLEDLNERGVAPDPTVVARLAELDISLPDHSSPLEETVALLDSYGAATMAMAGPRFFGFVIGGVLPATLAANWLAGAWDQNSALAEVTPLTAKLEDVALRWLCDVLCLPPETGVGFVTGATMANFTCLAVTGHNFQHINCSRIYQKSSISCFGDLKCFIAPSASSMADVRLRTICSRGCGFSVKKELLLLWRRHTR